MRRAILKSAFLPTALLVLAGAPAFAHFQEILPSADVLPEGGPVTLDLVFTHPMEGGPVMEMKKPEEFGVMVGGKVQDLTATLKSAPVTDKSAWRATYDFKAPGGAVFFVKPQPYFEPAEAKYIIHYAKVFVDGFASGEGWDARVGLPVEIAPLTRPTGLWTGNIFRGIVEKDGKSVPFAEIEVEYVNDGTVKPPNEAFITQIVKADQNGVFAYALPRAGWWGFAALVERDTSMAAPDGRAVPVELGGLIWVKATDMAPPNDAVASAKAK